MTKGTASHGKKGKTLHIHCRRCGRTSYHKKTGECSHCGFGKSSKLRKYSWNKRNHENKRVRV